MKKLISKLAVIIMCVIVSCMSLGTGIVANAASDDPSTIAKNVSLPANNKAVKMGQCIKLFVTASDNYSTIIAKKTKYGEFSLGMRQRLSLAQAFMERPELIVLDEPTNALDEKGIKEFHEIALEAKNDGATIIIASHSKEDIDILCDKIFCMENGKITKEFEK